LTAIIPLTAFGLGLWQIQRLQQKSELIARLEDQLVAIPLPLPPKVDPTQIPAFDHRRVVVTGVFRNDQEMLIGPRMRDGEQGYLVVTPLQRDDGSMVLISRGWIAKSKKNHEARNNDSGEALPAGKVRVMGMLREPIKKNMFTPDNRPGKGEWYFPDIKEMAAWVGADEVWIEETMGKLRGN
jgi:surfeit locus 1 family protein